MSKFNSGKASVLAIFATLVASAFLLGRYIAPTPAYASQPLQSMIEYYTAYNPGFVKSNTPFTSGWSTQSKNADGSVTVNVNAPGYADSGFVIYYGKLSDLSDFVLNGTGDSFGLNIWFDKDGDNKFFNWTGNTYNNVGGDSYILGPSSAGGVLEITDPSQFTSMIPGGGNYTLAQLKAGNASGIGLDTKIALWVGVTVGNGGTKSATLSLINKRAYCHADSGKKEYSYLYNSAWVAHFENNGTPKAGHEVDFFTWEDDRNCTGYVKVCTDPKANNYIKDLANNQISGGTCTYDSFVFPSCSSYIGINGNPHYDFGNPHQIVGEEGQRYGRDDVYALENGNYLQCFCPDEGNNGVQTNWLRTNDPIVGWFFENGLQWNLGNYNYAAQNLDFSCKRGATPTPAPTATPVPHVDDGGDGLGCAVNDCSGNQRGPEVLGTGTGGQILGASTMAGAGSFAEYANLVIMIVGGTLSFLGAKSLKKA